MKIGFVKWLLIPGVPSGGYAWLQRASSTRACFSYRLDELHGGIAVVDPLEGTVEQAVRFPMTAPQGNVSQTAYAVLSEGELYVLERERPGRCIVSTGPRRERLVVLPRVPPPELPVGMVESFWANAESVVYLHSGASGAVLKLVRVDWLGRVEWVLELERLFPDRDFTFFGHNLTVQADGTFAVYFNAIDHSLPGSPELIGVVHCSRDGERQDHRIVEKRDLFLPEYPFLDGGAGVMLEGKLAAHWCVSGTEPGKQLSRLSLRANTEPDCMLETPPMPITIGLETTQVWGAVTLGSFLVVGRGAGLAVYQMISDEDSEKI